MYTVGSDDGLTYFTKMTRFCDNTLHVARLNVTSGNEGFLQRLSEAIWYLTRGELEQCQSKLPRNMEDPVSISRNIKRKVTFHSVLKRHQLLGFKRTDKYTDGQLEEAEDDITGNSDLSEVWTKKGKNKPVAEFELLSSSKENLQEEETHINTTFKYDEESQNYHFLAAFGRKGKNIGEYQDAKSVSCLSSGKILITDYINSRLQICSDLSKTVTVFSPEEIVLPWATTVTQENNIAVTLCKDRCVKVFNGEGDVIISFGKDHFMKPTGIATDKNGNFIVCDSVTNKVSIFDNQGSFVRYLGNPEVKEECFNKPCYVCVSIAGDVIVSDGGNHKIKVFSSGGDFVRSFGSFGKGYKQFKSPYGVGTDKYGDIFVADHYNNRISMFTRDGVFIRHIVTSDHGLVHPQGLTISPDMLMYVSHGHLKASEILVFKLTTDVNYEHTQFISYV